MSKTYYCVKSFFIFERGARYYCFAVVENKYYFLTYNNPFGVNEVILSKDSVDENFKTT